MARRSRADAYAPQLPTLVDEVPRGDGWLHEVKLDGYRMGARLERGRARLLTRRGNDWTERFPELVEALEALALDDALLDGEAVLLDANGKSDFQALQRALGGGARAGLCYFAFDLLWLDGAPLRSERLADRKRRLEALLAGRESARLRYSHHWTGGGPTVFREACRLGIEGIVSKRADALYQPTRNPAWVKTKCVARQELVIGGYTVRGGTDDLASVLVGYYEGDALRFAGRVSAGIGASEKAQLTPLLARLRQDDCPFAAPPPGWKQKLGRWVKPRLVCEVELTEWTRDGLLRHPKLRGLREDKDPADVHREAPAATPRATPRVRRAPRRAGRPVVAGISLSSADRMLWPERGLTKRGLAELYAGLADWLVPHTEGRPLTLYWCPTGLNDACRFMKHGKAWAPGVVRRVHIQEKTKVGEYLVADTREALVALVQMDVVELHTWNSRAGDVERPDRVVFDLDPGPEVPFAEVVDAALLVKQALEALDLASWVKTTGGAGLHVVVPLLPERDWSACLAFSRKLAQAFARALPDRFTTAYAKAGRQRHILIDYLRNNRTNTSVSAFSVRAREGAPMSVPLGWDELVPSLDPRAFHPDAVRRRLARLRRDPWRDYFRARQRLPPASALGDSEGLLRPGPLR